MIMAEMVALGAAVVVLLVCARLHPKPGGRAASSPGHSRRWPWIGVAGVAVGVVSPLVGVAVAISAAVWSRWSGVRRAARIKRHTVAAFPDALDLLVLSIRAGYLPAQAIVEITPFLPPRLCPAFIAVGEAMQRGERFGDALGQLKDRLGPVAQSLVDSLSAADRYGLPLAPVLERLSFEARQQRRRDAEAMARELPVRLAMPLVLCTLPSFVLLAIVPLLLGALSSLHT